MLGRVWYLGVVWVFLRGLDDGCLGCVLRSSVLQIVTTQITIVTIHFQFVFLCENCRAIKTKGMVFRYTWVYSKEDTMAHTYRSMVTS